MLKLLPVLALAILCPAQTLEDVIAALGKGRHQEALQALDRLLEASPANPQLLTLRGIAQHGAGQTERALQSFRAALKNRPDYLPALQGAAEIEYNTGKPEALPRLERLTEVAPANYTAHAMLAVLHFEKDRYADAVRHFELARPVLQENPSALWQYAQSLYQLERFNTAAAAFEQLLAATPDRSEARFNLALCRFAENRYADALRILEPLLEAGKPDLAALRLAASAHQSQDNLAEAIALLRRAVTLYPREEHVYLDLANLCLNHNSFDLGIEIIDAALKAIEPTARLHTMRGILYVQSGRTERAEADFEAAHRLAPDSAYGQVGLSITMMESDRIDESIRLLRQQRKADPDNASVNFVLAQALLKKGSEPGTPDHAEAQAILERLVRNNPRHGAAQALLGKLHLSNGDTGKAMELFERAIELEPADRTAAYQLMLAYNRTGQRDKAAAMQRRVRDLIAQEREQEIERNRIRLIKAPGRFISNER